MLPDQIQMKQQHIKIEGHTPQHFDYSFCVREPIQSSFFNKLEEFQKQYCTLFQKNSSTLNTPDSSKNRETQNIITQSTQNSFRKT